MSLEPRKPKRIGLDGRLYKASRGGIGRYSRELISELLKIDKINQYVLFLTPADAKECILKANNLEKVIVDIPHFSFAEQLVLPQIIGKEKLDLMHFLNFNHPLIYGCKYITTVHDLTMTFYPVGRQRLFVRRQLYLLLMDHAVKSSSAVISPTQSVKDDIVKTSGVDPDKVKVIYEGATAPAQAVSQPSKQWLKGHGLTKPFILFLSQWRPHKGILTLVEAFSKIKKTTDIQLVIAGQPNPSFPEIPAAVEASPYRSDILTPGFVDDDLLDHLYAAAKLFIFPSLYEGFGLPPLEAMARGLPVVASNTSVMPEVLGDAAVYFEPENSADLAKKITQLLADPKKMTSLSIAGKKRAKQFSWRKMAEETLALYESILN